MRLKRSSTQKRRLPTLRTQSQSSSRSYGRPAPCLRTSSSKSSRPCTTTTMETLPTQLELWECVSSRRASTSKECSDARADRSQERLLEMSSDKRCEHCSSRLHGGSEALGEIARENQYPDAVQTLRKIASHQVIFILAGNHVQYHWWMRSNGFTKQDEPLFRFLHSYDQLRGRSREKLWIIRTGTWYSRPDIDIMNTELKYLALQGAHVI
jgi:hypothetical protein